MNNKAFKENCKRLISPFVEYQFPQIYRESGEQLVEFVKAYYEFEEETQYQFLNKSECFEEKDDIDIIEEEFVVHFKEKYMRDMPLLNSVDNRFIIKNILDLYRSKGTERSLKLLLKLIYGIEDAKVYYPGQDVLRPSHSVWWQPRYLELSQSGLTPTLVGKSVKGSISKATAFVESFVTKRINGQLIDVAYLSNVRGNFVTNEFITDGLDSFFNYPYVVGSLSTIDVDSGGAGFSVGDLLDVVSQNGEFGIAKVDVITGIDTQISWEIVDPGTGYSATAYANGAPIADSATTIYVSDSVLGIENSNLVDGDVLTQYLETLTLASATTVSVGDLVTVGAKTGHVVEVNGNDVVIETTSTESFLAEATVDIGGNTISVTAAVDSAVVATVMDSDDKQVWLYDTVGGPYQYTSAQTNYAYDTAGVQYEIQRVYRGSGASFEIVNLGDTNSATYFTDTIGDNNFFGIRYLDTTLDSFDFGFPKRASLTQTTILATIIDDALGQRTITIGSPLSLSMVNIGSDYDTDVRAKVVNSAIAGNEIYDLEMYVNTTQDSITSFSVGQELVQQNGARGIITGISGNQISVRPITFDERFVVGQMITNETLANFASANPYVTPYRIDNDTSSAPMGTNMVVKGSAQQNEGVVQSIKLIVSGFGYVDGEAVTLYPHDGRDPITGIANLGNAGLTAGTWKTTTSHLNWSTYIHDNDYYQEYSYEITAPTSLDKYEDVVHNITHVSGTKLFGKVEKNATYAEGYNLEASVEII